MKSNDKLDGKQMVWVLIVAIGFIAVTIASVFPPLAALIVLAGVKMKQDYFDNGRVSE